MAMPFGVGCYLDRGWHRGSRWERALPAADRSAFVERGSRSTRTAALAALLLVTLCDIGRHLLSGETRTKHGQVEPSVRANPAPLHEQPVVVPQVMHLRQVPLRTMVNWPHSPHGSPS
jgi:hypothetical protein